MSKIFTKFLRFLMVSQTLTVNMENCNNHHKTSLYIHLVVNYITIFYHVWELCTKLKFSLQCWRLPTTHIKVNLTFFFFNNDMQLESSQDCLCTAAKLLKFISRYICTTVIFWMEQKHMNIFFFTLSSSLQIRFWSSPDCQILQA